MRKPETAVILGTRPEIIKMSPVIRLLQKESWPFYLIHTGQHYSYNMDQQFFKDLGLPDPLYKFVRSPDLGPNRHDELVRQMTARILDALKERKPSVVLVQGDTDTVLAGARAAHELGGITIGHVEAGLRSRDLDMPEERNRIEADRLSHILFAPTEAARSNLIQERLDSKRVEVTGNTVVDALLQNLAIAEKRADKSLQKGYALVTLHRPETVDDKERFTGVIRALESFAQKAALKRVVFPMHPRTRQRFKEFGITLSDAGRRLIATPEPMGFLDFIWHEKNADILLTDSGGVQEEACILGVPCVTIRTTTERPETVEAGANVVAGYEPQTIVNEAMRMLTKPRTWKNPYGDGKAAERILRALETDRVEARR